MNENQFLQVMHQTRRAPPPVPMVFLVFKMKFNTLIKMK